MFDSDPDFDQDAGAGEYGVCHPNIDRTLVPDRNDSDRRGTSVTCPAGEAICPGFRDISAAERARRQRCPYSFLSQQ